MLVEYNKPNIVANTLQERNFHRNLNFAILLMAKSLNFNSAYYYIVGNLSMIGYIIEFEKLELANIQFREFYQFEPGCQIKSHVYLVWHMYIMVWWFANTISV